jgi:hypothetical protein
LPRFWGGGIVPVEKPGEEPESLRKGRGGRDQFTGGPGRDVAYGYAGNDTFFMDERFASEVVRRDVLWGGPGYDFAERDWLDVLHSIENAPPRARERKRAGGSKCAAEG